MEIKEIEKQIKIEEEKNFEIIPVELPTEIIAKIFEQDLRLLLKCIILNSFFHQFIQDKPNDFWMNKYLKLHMKANIPYVIIYSEDISWINYFINHLKQKPEERFQIISNKEIKELKERIKANKENLIPNEINEIINENLYDAFIYLFDDLLLERSNLSEYSNLLSKIYSKITKFCTSNISNASILYNLIEWSMEKIFTIGLVKGFDFILLHIKNLYFILGYSFRYMFPKFEMENVFPKLLDVTIKRFTESKLYKIKRVENFNIEILLNEYPLPIVGEDLIVHKW